LPPTIAKKIAATMRTAAARAAFHGSPRRVSAGVALDESAAGGARGRNPFGDRCNKSITSLRDRLDVLLYRAVLTQRLSQNRDAATQRPFFDEAVVPDVGDQLFSFDEMSVVLDEDTQHVEHLRRDRQHAAVVQQPLLRDVEAVRTELVSGAARAGHQ